jgi:hypothetical protein
MHDFSIDLLPSFEYGLYAADGTLLATFPTQSHAERAARNLYGFASPAPLDPVMYGGDGFFAPDAPRPQPQTPAAPLYRRLLRHGACQVCGKRTCMGRFVPGGRVRFQCAACSRRATASAYQKEPVL